MRRPAGQPADLRNTPTPLKWNAAIEADLKVRLDEMGADGNPRRGGASGPPSELRVYTRRVKTFVILISVFFGSGCALSRAISLQPGGAARVSQESVRAHMEFLAGDALDGRGSGTRDEWIAVTYAAAQMRRLGLEPLGDAGGYVQSIATPGEGNRTWNAVGRLSGRDAARRSEVILLSAHIDHLGNRAGQANAAADTVYNGADDDASGTIAVLELMEALARGPKPRRTVIFALFGSEERGGAGSRAFADRPPVPLTQIVANLQFEMIGRPDGTVPARTLWLTGYERSNLGPALAGRGARLVQDPHPEMSFFTRSDNIQFARRGVVAHTVSSYGLHKDYHQPSDEVGTIDFAHMTRAIASMLGSIRWLANSDFKPEWVPGMRP